MRLYRTLTAAICIAYCRWLNLHLFSNYSVQRDPYKNNRNLDTAYVLKIRVSKSGSHITLHSDPQHCYLLLLFDTEWRKFNPVFWSESRLDPTFFWYVNKMHWSFFWGDICSGKKTFILTLDPDPNFTRCPGNIQTLYFILLQLNILRSWYF